MEAAVCITSGYIRTSKVDFIERLRLYWVYRIQRQLTFGVSVAF